MAIEEKIFRPELLALYVISLLSGFSMGIFNPLISVLMEQHGVNQILIGANASLYYFCIAVFAPFAARLIRRFGLAKIIVVGILVTTVSTSLFPLTTDIYAWFFLRALMGLGICLYMVAGQTGLNTYANSEKRGVIVAIHGSSFGIGFMISPLIGSVLYAHYPTLAFLFGSGVIFLGVFVIFSLSKDIAKQHYSSSLAIFRKISIALHGAFIYGALEGIIVTLLPVIMLRHVVSVELSALPLPLFMVASGLGMIPVSYFGDRFGQKKILLASAIIGLLTLAAMFFFEHTYSVAIGAVFLGLSVGTFFPVTLAMIGNLLPSSDMPTGSGLFTASFSYGCAVGPLCAAILMSLFGDTHVFSLIFVLLVLLVVRMIPGQSTSLQPITSE